MKVIKAKYPHVFRPCTIEWVTKDKKGTANLRKIWDLEGEDLKIPGKDKWNTELNLDNNNTWSYYYTLPHKCKLNARAIST